MHSSAFGAAARMVLRSFSSAARLSSLKVARYSSTVVTLVLRLIFASPLATVERQAARSTTQQDLIQEGPDVDPGDPRSTRRWSLHVAPTSQHNGSLVLKRRRSKWRK